MVYNILNHIYTKITVTYNRLHDMTNRIIYDFYSSEKN